MADITPIAGNQITGVGEIRPAAKIFVPADWWALPGITAVAAYDPITATDLADSYTNMANPGTHTAYAQGTNALSMALVEDGWECRNQKCIRCAGLSPVAIGASMICIYYIDLPTDGYVYGAYDGNRWKVGVINSASYRVSEGSTGSTTITSPYPVGRPVTLGISGGRFYVNGVDISPVTTGTKPIHDISIGALSTSAAAFSNQKSCDVAAFWAGPVLDSAQMLDLHNRMVAL